MAEIDREKVINDLQDAVNDDWMWQHADYYAKAMENAIALLKEQETVPVYEDKINKCECGETICRYWHPTFCGFCGRKWLWY